MKFKLKAILALSLLPQIVLVKWLSNYPLVIEKYYSQGIYSYISGFFRFTLGRIPFSVGDILYASLLFLGLRYLILKRKCIWNNKLNFLVNIGLVIAVAYFTFNLSWGLNYHRVPIAKALKIEENKSRKDLLVFVNTLINHTNNIQEKIAGDTTKIITTPYSTQEIFDKTLEGYKSIEKIHPFLKYENPSIKKSIFSSTLSYMGYGGYLNPFTNEAQVNALIPPFRLSVISGHEIGHQIGYSAENETNLIGYLVTLHNDDIYFKYAAQAYALSYCLSDIKRNDEELFYKLLPKLNKGVLKNYEELTNFWKKYENVTEPVFKTIFNTFLKANNQKDGIESYSKVVLLLVSYHQKYPL
ncbi:DUF3810 domain-containing protein [Cellulophaga sp. HaHaR_3_176]|uniref:DUF3810 domain-containing protein n=1 Tax=Cellulophaga sp. HaHaR_3_176 TaxID=1942464 RepID=UPI001C1F97D2|nr:DUF3810 domain-containing protein [Cellulophaga sp. HaHaR_3_176]QWX82492.1 DUF3810 domain-containing protein [Cellulophaga sp. HaHaR_3_176]